MLRRLDARHDRFGLKAPFRIARGVKTAADVVTVTIAQGACVGRGEAVPYARYGETIEAALAAIDSVAPLLRAGAGRTELLRILPPGAARNAVDGALWDLDAQRAGTTVAALAGLPEPAAVASAITIGLDAPDAMAAAAARVAAVPLLKVKVDRDHAAAQIAAVRAAAPAPRLIVDPNESWSIDEVVAPPGPAGRVPRRSARTAAAGRCGRRAGRYCVARARLRRRIAPTPPPISMRSPAATAWSM